MNWFFDWKTGAVSASLGAALIGGSIYFNSMDFSQDSNYVKPLELVKYEELDKRVTSIDSVLTRLYNGFENEPEVVNHKKVSELTLEKIRIMSSKDYLKGRENYVENLRNYNEKNSEKENYTIPLAVGGGLLFLLGMTNLSENLRGY